MPVLIEAITVVLRRDAIDAKLTGGWNALRELIPNKTFCTDGTLARVAFLDPDAVRQFVEQLEAGGPPPSLAPRRRAPLRTPDLGIRLVQCGAHLGQGGARPRGDSCGEVVRDPHQDVVEVRANPGCVRSCFQRVVLLQQVKAGEST